MLPSFEKAQLYCTGIVKTATSLAPAKAVGDNLRGKGDQVTFVAFIERLAYEMIHNNITDTPNGNFKQRRRARSDDDKEDIEVDEWSELEDNDSSSKASCRYKPLWNLQKFKNGNKRGYGLRCYECGEKAYNYCSTCSTTK
jgi:hypothetical protein